MLRPEYPIVTRRLALRPLGEDDVAQLLAYRGQPEVCRYLPFEPMDEQMVRTRLDGDLGRREITEQGQGLTLGVELAATGRLIGDVMVFYRSAKHSGGEIGYVLHPDFTGNGYATEACAAVLDLAFDASGGLALRRIVARMDARNHASEGVARRLGMRREAHFRSSEWFKGAWSDLVVYALLDHEWRASTERSATRTR